MQTLPAPQVTACDTNPETSKTLRSTLVSRNVTIADHRTSVRLEPEMWSGLLEISRRERATLHEVCTAVARHKDENTSLTAAIRVFVMSYYRAAATEEGHTKAGHGYGVGIIVPNTAAIHLVPPASTSTASATPRPQSSPQTAPVHSPYMMGYSRMNGAVR